MRLSAPQKTCKKQLAIGLSGDVKQKLEQLAAMTGQSKTQIIAEAIQSYMLRYPNAQSKRASPLS